VKLLESIASYTAESRRRIESVLTDEVKEIIVRIVRSPDAAAEVDGELIDEPVEMDVFRCEGGRLIPNTAIFFEDDIERLREPVFQMGRDRRDRQGERRRARALLSEYPQLCREHYGGGAGITRVP
jgi:hypothetical protein